MVVNICPHCRQAYREGVRFCPVDGSAVPQVHVADPYLGQRLMGQFEIEALAGSGAMGTVYRATQTSMGRTVAVKILRRDLLDDADALTRFLREAHAVARLSHPNIVTVHLVDRTEDGAPYIVMEYVDGESLGAVCARELRLELGRVLRIARQIASALGEAHSHGIVHRDLKPENILLVHRRRERDFVKVLDFGIAKIISGDPGQAVTKAGTIFGTPHYISPEQAAGREVDPRADLYSLGVVLFRMVTGRLPFEGNSGVQVLMRHVHEMPPRPSVLCPELPVPLEVLILRALEKDRDRRWQSAEQMIEALTRVEASAPLDPASRTLLGVGRVVESSIEPHDTKPEPAPAVKEERDRLAVPQAALPDDEDTEPEPLPGATAPYEVDTGRGVIDPSLVEAAEQGRVRSRAVRRRWTAWRLMLAAGVGGAALGIFYATRHAPAPSISAVDAGRPLTSRAKPLEWPPVLFAERVLSAGPYAARVGFTAPPQQGATVTLLLALSDKHGWIEGAQIEGELRERERRAAAFRLDEVRGGYRASLSFSSAGRTSLRFSIRPPGGESFRDSVEIEVAAVSPPSAPAIGPALPVLSPAPAARPRRPGKASVGSKAKPPVRIRETVADELPLTEIPVSGAESTSAPRALGPADEGGERENEDSYR